MGGFSSTSANRRGVLRNTATAVAAVALGGSLTACGPSGRRAGPVRTIPTPTVLVWGPWMGFLAKGGTAAATAALYAATQPFRAKHRGVEIKVSITAGANNAAPNSGVSHKAQPYFGSA